ncbi:SigE family RNA polymerase sigma factor [Herbidospora daliensis]|uniref:SigE family RNA polymerase sigma factor n=1 Tax=Herbidospora daliensis TaxID=295585 RepID=UPI000785D77A|nr:SigE family RNA polymerase sigma factor [Herbidospora daliensis]
MRADEGFREFVGQHQRAWIRTAYLLTGDAHLAEDLLQSVLIKVLGKWSGLDQPDAYVRKALVNQYISWRRRPRREIPRAEPPDRSYTSEDTALTRLMVQRALMRLSPRQRAVIVLRYYEDRTERETAEILGCSLGTVKSQAHHALARLREFTGVLTDIEEARR